MSFGFTDRADLPTPDRNRKVVVRCRLMQARVKSIWIVDGAGVEAWLPRREISIEGEVRVGQDLRVTLPAWRAEQKRLTHTVGEGQGSLFR